jgi:membrane protein implicated in regulation of membrane protease activity
LDLVGLIVVAAIFEFATLDLVSIWFAIAAIPSFILSILRVDPVIQVVVFVFISVMLLGVTRPVVMKYFKTNEIKTNVDSYVGSTGIVLGRITPDKPGLVKVKNLEWTAVATEIIEVDEHVRVLDIEGVKLIVEKI